jgi:branched-chain amino acid transport system substrate-binding protein
VMANMVPYLPEIPPAADGGMEGLYAVAPIYIPDFSVAIEDEWVSSWHLDYVARFGEEPAPQSVMGYVMADLLIRALEAAGPDVTVEKMLAGLEGISQYDNPFGGPTMSFSPQKHMAGDYLSLYQVKDRKWMTVVESLPY